MEFKKFSEWMKNYGGAILTTLSIAAMLFGGAVYVIRAEVADVRSDLGTVKSDISDLKTGSKDTNGRIDELLKQVLDRAFPAPNATKASIRESLPQMKGVLQLAKEFKVGLSPEKLISYGRQVTSLTANYDATNAQIRVLGDLLDCRSVLNAKDSPEDHLAFPFQLYKVGETALVPAVITAKSTSTAQKGTFTSEVPQHVVPPDHSFIYWPLDRQPQKLTKGLPFLKVTGIGEVSFLLDGNHIKNVIFRNATIVYNGGPVVLEDVYFEDCKFEVDPIKSRKPAAQTDLFAKAVLERVPMAYSGQ